MKFLFDVIPFVLFYIVSLKWNLIVATAVAIAATAVQILVTLLAGRKVQTMQWVSMGLIAVFGGMTLLSANPIFVMWRSSVVNWLLAAVLLVDLLIIRKNLLKAMMGTQLEMPDFAWRTMTWGVAILFVIMGVLNIVVAKNFSQLFWLNYKTLISPIITFVFFMGLILMLSRHMTLPSDRMDEKSRTTPPEGHD